HSYCIGTLQDITSLGEHAGPPSSPATCSSLAPATYMKRFSLHSRVFFSSSALSKGTDLEKAVATAALVYDNAADTNGKLSKSDAKNLLQTQFMHFMQGQETKPKYQEIISALDENKNDQLDFEDFMVQLLSLTLMSDLWKEIQNVKKTK
uniref:Sentan, cilia apical structure protein n=1 Tax=Varanus komodoensis TaxID=61221 RepID=A0A8D2LEH0_VARKO